MEVHKNVVYHNDPKGESSRHQLDLFLPRGKKNVPVVVLVHGGAWMVGDNRCCGLYSSVGEFLAGQGIAVAMPNYRLSPRVKHPEHIKDVARAVAWTHRNIKSLGGSPGELFLAGHSAGGHLVSLLATDDSYLRAEGLKVSDIQGVISISGVYRIPEGPMKIKLGGTDDSALRLAQTSPIRKETSERLFPALGPGLPLEVDIFAPVFGKDASARRLASPIRHVHPGLPPFLLVTAENDLPTLGPMAAEFHRALLDHGCSSQLLHVEKRNHNSILFLAVRKEDEVAASMLHFIRRHAAK